MEGMTLTHQNIIATFEGARSQESPFVFVGVEAEGIKEIIAVPAESYDAKEQFYLRSYTNELVHVMNSNVRIFGLSHGDNDCLRDVLGEKEVLIKAEGSEQHANVPLRFINWHMDYLSIR